MLPKITFVLIKDKQVQMAETIEADLEAIKCRISHIQEQGFDSAVAVFSNLAVNPRPIGRGYKAYHENN